MTLGGACTSSPGAGLPFCITDLSDSHGPTRLFEGLDRRFDDATFLGYVWFLL